VTKTWQMEFNVGKCEVMYFSRQNQREIIYMERHCR